MTFFRIGVILLPYAAAEAMGKEKDNDIYAQTT